MFHGFQEMQLTKRLRMWFDHDRAAPRKALKVTKGHFWTGNILKDKQDAEELKSGHRDHMT